MSGFVAIIRADGAAIDRDFAQTLTASLASRGPDNQSTRCLGSAALGHALLRCGDPFIDVCQPLTIDGDTWIAADARLDDRSTLVAALGPDASASMSDAELLLRAFAKWDAACVERVSGDFAFAIWTLSRRQLLCARDQMGVKPLYYARVGPWLLAGSAIDCLRLCPDVPKELDDCAVADFLLFGHTTDDDATTFRHVRRVPPGHSMTWSARADVALRRYWRLPIEEPLYLRSGEYAEQLRTLLGEAVRDRARTERLTIFLSGGLDSGVVAATAARQLNVSGDHRLRACTYVHRSLTSDDEDLYAAETARHLQMPWTAIHVDEANGWGYFAKPDTPEPLLSVPDAQAEAKGYAAIARYSRVAFDGEGADNALTYEWQAYLAHLVRRGQWNRLAGDAFAFMTHVRRLPLSNALVSAFARRRGATGATPGIPSWLEPLAARLDLSQRWTHVMRAATSEHPTRPAGYFSLQLPLWQSMFASVDPAYTGALLEVRYPFLDLRLIRFLMRVPAVPWCRGKHLLRYAFRHDLPDAVRRRPKSPLRRQPYVEKIRRDGLPPVSLTPGLERYGSPRRLNMEEATSSAAAAEAAVRFAAFSQWFARLESASTSTD